MFKIFGLNDVGNEFSYFVWEEEVAAERVKQLNTENYAVAYEEAYEEKLILEIGEKVGLKLGDAKDFYLFLRRLMDRLEGKEMFVNEMQFLVMYRQKLL